jgi:hypothetical protein
LILTRVTNTRDLHAYLDERFARRKAESHPVSKASVERFPMAWTARLCELKNALKTMYVKIQMMRRKRKNDQDDDEGAENGLKDSRLKLRLGCATMIP